jgi:hypothetical protein
VEHGKEQEGRHNIFLCKWNGWDPMDNTWEVTANIIKYGGGDILKEYIKKMRHEQCYFSFFL